MKTNSKAAWFSILSGLLLTTPALAVSSSAEFRPSVIYGEDNRQEVYSTTSMWNEFARSIAGKVSVDHMQGSGGSWELIGEPLSRKTCSSARFSDQITVPSCTGFLARPNLLITAGHCIKSQEDCDKFRWVFGYQLKSSGDRSYTHVGRDQVYSCKKVVARRFEGFGAVDYAIIELDRPVEGRKPLILGFDTPVNTGQSLVALGHPSGLPMKITESGIMTGLADEDKSILSDLDMFQGNSGSPVMDFQSGTVLGITSHGHADYVRDDQAGGCKVPRICKPGDNCHPSSASRIINLKDEPSLKSN